MSATLIVEILNIVTSIGILFLEAIGLAIIFGLMRVVNLAHGEFVMLGAYVAYMCSVFHLNPWVSIVAAPIVLGVFGLIIERLLIRRLYGKIMESILATWGLSIVIRQVIELTFGKMYKNVPTPTEASIHVAGSTYPDYRFVILAVAIVVLVGMLWLQRKTLLGTKVTAVIANPSLSMTLGINVNRVYMFTFVVGSMLAGLAGALIAPIVTVYPGMGITFIIQAFLTVLVGGVASIPGLTGSSSLLSTTDNVVSFLSSPVLGSISVLVIALLVMRLRKSSVS